MIIVSIEDNDTWFSCSDFDFKNFYSVNDGPEIITESELLQKNPNKILINSYSDLKYLDEKFNSVFRELAECKKLGLEHFDEKVQNQVDRLYDYFRKYGFDCTIEVFSYIGKGYSADLEFKNNIDKFGEGIAEYISEAIEYYVNRHK